MSNINHSIQGTYLNSNNIEKVSLVKQVENNSELIVKRTYTPRTNCRTEVKYPGYTLITEYF